MSPVIYNLVMSGNYELALYLNLFSAVSDFLDGKIARTWPSQQSTLGKHTNYDSYFMIDGYFRHGFGPFG